MQNSPQLQVNKLTFCHLFIFINTDAMLQCTELWLQCTKSLTTRQVRGIKNLIWKIIMHNLEKTFCVWRNKNPFSWKLLLICDALAAQAKNGCQIRQPLATGLLAHRPTKFCQMLCILTSKWVFCTDWLVKIAFLVFSQLFKILQYHWMKIIELFPKKTRFNGWKRVFKRENLFYLGIKHSTSVLVQIKKKKNNFFAEFCCKFLTFLCNFSL